MVEATVACIVAAASHAFLPAETDHGPDTLALGRYTAIAFAILVDSGRDHTAVKVLAEAEPLANVPRTVGNLANHVVGGPLGSRVADLGRWVAPGCEEVFILGKRRASRNEGEGEGLIS